MPTDTPKIEHTTTVTAEQLRTMLAKSGLEIPETYRITMRITKGAQRLELRWDPK